MFRYLRFLKNKIVISLVGLLCLGLIIWFGGPLIKFGEDNHAPLADTTMRLIAIIVLLVLWGLNNLRVQIQNKKNNEELVEDLQDNQEELLNNALEEQTNEEIKLLNQRFTQALSTLKKMKFKGAGGKKALYELPWYIIIGPPGAGKTTALINSSLEFPLAEELGQGALQGVGGTRNCDWWFTDQAVLIDTAGRYTTQDSHKVADSSAWGGFLNLLKKNRRRRPINGAIVAISLQDLLIQSEEERSQHAKIIRQRIDELMDKLGVRFPVYLLFTKADLVAGFAEFFEDVARDDREQVWGVSLPNLAGDGDTPDFDGLADEYQSLVRRLYDRVLWRVHSERDTRRRALINGFPQQMENLGPLIQSFLRQTFAKNRYQYQPYLRGIYFTSGTQDGTPIDRLMSAASANFGFPPAALQATRGQGKSFFLGELFRHVIFPEAELVGVNKKYERARRWGQRAGFVGMSAVGAVIAAVWFASYNQHASYMEDVQKNVADFKKEEARLPKHSKQLMTVLPSLNALGRASIVYDQEEHPWLTGIGMYDAAVDDEADEAYVHQLRQLYLPRLIAYLESYIKRGHEAGDLYSTFRTYLMFKKQEHMDHEVITKWFDTQLKRDFSNKPAEVRALQVHLEHLLAAGFTPPDLNPRLVKSTRSLLLRVPVGKRIYSRIRTNPDYIRPVDMLNEFGESVRKVYTVNGGVERAMQVPLLFTLSGYENIDMSADSGVVEDILRDKWVLTDDESEQVDFIKEDLQDVSRQVKDLYLSEYKSKWEDLYRNLKVAPFADLSHANDVLSRMVDPVYSPLMSIVQVGAMNTQLSTQLFANLADDNQKGAKGKAAQFAAANTKWTVVDKRFRQLNVLLREDKQGRQAITDVVERIRELQIFIDELNMAPDVGQSAFEIAKARYAGGGGNPITKLKLYAKTAPAPLDGWLKSLADQSWKVVLRSAKRYVDSEWQAQVYREYQRGLEGRYPLLPTASEDITITDFSEFFKPAGILDTFFIEYVKPFIKTRSGWSNKAVDGYSLGISKNTLKQLKSAIAIRETFFKENPEAPVLSFQLKPLKMDKRDARFVLDMGEQRISYRHGPKMWKTITWEANDAGNRIRLMFEDLESRRYTQSYEGAWAWFRLQDASNVGKTGRTNVYKASYSVRSRVDAGGGDTDEQVRTIQYELRPKSVNNPFGKDLLGGFKCPSKL